MGLAIDAVSMLQCSNRYFQQTLWTCCVEIASDVVATMYVEYIAGVASWSARIGKCEIESIEKRKFCLF